MNVADIYSITLQGAVASEQFRSVFFYRVQAIDGPQTVTTTQLLANMAEAHWSIAMLPAYQPVAGTNVSFETYRIFNLFDVTELYEGDANAELPMSGAVVGEKLPPFAAFGFSQPSSIRGVRRGQKRLPGVAETQQADGVFTGGVFAQMQSVAEDLGLPIAVPVAAGLEATLFPVIVKRVKETDPETGKVTYRLPETVLEATWYPAESWVPYENVTTQNSRKIGRGI